MSENKRIDVAIWDVDKLIPYDKNAKKHSKEQVEQIAGLIQMHGFTQPIVIDQDGVVVAGHGRRLAALHLKLDKVPVRVLVNYKKADIDALRLADNRVVSNDYDAALLKEEFFALNEEGVDLKFLGFSDQELEIVSGDAFEDVDTNVFIDDVSGAVANQKQENEKAQEDTDATAAPVADALGFKRVTVAQSRKIRWFISSLENQHGKRGVEALLDHIREIEELAA